MMILDTMNLGKKDITFLFNYDTKTVLILPRTFNKIGDKEMDKYGFVKYSAQRYGIDESFAETMVDMFADCLQELVAAGQSVNIDEIGEFKTTPMFPKNIPHHGNEILAKLAKKYMVSFKASKQLTKLVA